MQQPVATRKRPTVSDKEKLYLGPAGQTFSNDEKLPNLPVASLQSTIQKYLDSVRPHVTDEEFAQTEGICREFRDGIGADLHAKLQKRAKGKRNWLEQWWEDEGYLSLRYPLSPLLNMAGSLPLEDLYVPDREAWLDRAGVHIYWQLQFWKILRTEQLRAFVNRNIPWSMNQFRRLFNTTRIPGEHKDEIQCWFKTESQGAPGPRHIAVLCQGHIFAFDVIDDKEEPLTAPEITKQLQSIYEWCQANLEGPGVGALTVADRTTWAKNRAHLLELHPSNCNSIATIDQAILNVVLDNREPSTNTETFMETLGGDCTNRWADKSSTTIVFRNGVFAGNSDHAPFDGLVIMALAHYGYISMKETGGTWQGTEKVRDLPKPWKIEIHIDEDIENEIQTAKDGFTAMVGDIEAQYSQFFSYGKDFLRPYNVRPEAYVQLALQLAYFRMHKRPGSTYVTASTRPFYHGRTETCRSCTNEAMEFVKSMDNADCSAGEKMKLLNTAVQKFNYLLIECMKGQGVDRHLFGLYQIAKEEGMEPPAIFQDPSYVKSGGGGNFVLSTSCSGYTPLVGGVPPMCEQGYGAFYSIENHRMNFITTAYRRCEETSVEKFYQHVHDALIDMQQLLLSAKL